jgi:hypothetical protein
MAFTKSAASSDSILLKYTIRHRFTSPPCHFLTSDLLKSDASNKYLLFVAVASGTERLHFSRNQHLLSCCPSDACLHENACTDLAPCRRSHYWLRIRSWLCHERGMIGGRPISTNFALEYALSSNFPRSQARIFWASDIGSLRTTMEQKLMAAAYRLGALQFILPPLRRALQSEIFSKMNYLTYHCHTM